MNVNVHTFKNVHGAVIATRPVSSEFCISPRLYVTIPFSRYDTRALNKIEDIIDTAEHRAVLTQARDARWTCPLETAPEEPPLKKNHAKYNISVPWAVKTELCPSIRRTTRLPFSVTNLLKRGPIIQAAANAHEPPHRCTHPDPAKSMQPCV